MLKKFLLSEAFVLPRALYIDGILRIVRGDYGWIYIGCGGENCISCSMWYNMCCEKEENEGKEIGNFT